MHAIRARQFAMQRHAAPCRLHGHAMQRQAAPWQRHAAPFAPAAAMPPQLHAGAISANAAPHRHASAMHSIQRMQRLPSRHARQCATAAPAAPCRAMQRPSAHQSHAAPTAAMHPAQASPSRHASLTIAGRNAAQNRNKSFPPRQALLDPDVGTSPWGDGAPPAKVLLLGPASGKSDKSSISSGPASRYQCITLSDEDSDNADEPKCVLELEGGKYLWKKFDAKIFSMYCISYRDQSKIVAAYQGENILSGLSCRLIETEIQAFSLGHTLFDPATSSYKV
eukprot:gene16320-22509_t